MGRSPAGGPASSARSQTSTRGCPRAPTSCRSRSTRRARRPPPRCSRSRAAPARRSAFVVLSGGHRVHRSDLKSKSHTSFSSARRCRRGPRSFRAESRRRRLPTHVQRDPEARAAVRRVRRPFFGGKLRRKGGDAVAVERRREGGRPPRASPTRRRRPAAPGCCGRKYRSRGDGGGFGGRGVPAPDVAGLPSRAATPCRRPGTAAADRPPARAGAAPGGGHEDAASVASVARVRVVDCDGVADASAEAATSGGGHALPFRRREVA